MKGLITILCSVLPFAFAVAVTDVYSLKMTLRVPQVVNNSESLGKRQYKTQRFDGTLEIEYSDEGRPDVRVSALTNRSFKVGGVRVRYETDVVSSVWNLVGNNKTGVFKSPSVCIGIDALPSYVASYEPTNDNSLILTLSGKGSSAKRIFGYAAGTLGCGCTEYGHTSPTRVAGAFGPLSIVDDVASVFGTWSATRKARRD